MSKWKTNLNRKTQKIIVIGVEEDLRWEFKTERPIRLKKHIEVNNGRGQGLWEVVALGRR